MSQKELIAAIEKAIDQIEEQQTTINRIEAGLTALNMKVQNLERRVSKVDAIPGSIAEIKSTLSILNSRTTEMKNNLDIVTLDTNAQHQTYEHGQDVLGDWRAELEAEMMEPQLTRADIEHRTDAYNNRRTASGLHPIH